MASSAPDTRSKLLNTLLSKIEDDPYPSGTYMDLAEELLTPDDLPRYVEVLFAKVDGERFPSVTMLRRLQNLVS
ncbi:hypothetical protein GCM10011492_27480 [Flexivirga endophytica]|uniref:Uncharacterized protein n=1 Tax=Flexivirga endophytica TaxID=1849103 RepID=A0A916T9K9_9MICO|nr:hypothetical protein [Flexivirga endophytica]GGB35305.1 hypothetical protein GCM10011492_27480 [Flexivirga endophytica]GHB43100.1 hypothetical protein GCM10008112_09860 [Flexivirga endophytica]